MGQAGEDAALRIMLRQMAPQIKQTFVSAATHLNEPVAMLYLILGFKPESDFQNPLDNFIQIKSILSKQTLDLMEDPTKKNDQANSQLIEIFPIAKELIFDQATEWNLTAHDVFIVVRLKPDANQEHPDGIDLRIKTKKYVVPQREHIVS